MRVAVMGAGAVGGYFGARLAAGGHDLTFITRGERLSAMREGGILVKSIDGDLDLEDVEATDDPAGVGEVELVIFSVKSTGTREAAEVAQPLVRPGTVVLALQNGVENEAVLGEVLGEEHVLPAVAVIGVAMPEPGHILHTNNGSITLGEISGNTTERVLAVREAFADAGVGTRVIGDILSVKWRKLIWNAAFNLVHEIGWKSIIFENHGISIFQTGIIMVHERIKILPNQIVVPIYLIKNPVLTGERRSTSSFFLFFRSHTLIHKISIW